MSSLDSRVDAMRAGPDAVAEIICPHMTGRDGDQLYAMRAPRSGKRWLVCRDCCRRNLELIDLTRPQETPS